VHIHPHQRQPKDLRIVFSLTFFNETTEQKNITLSTARYMTVAEPSWGFPKVWRMEDLTTMAYNYRKAEEMTVYIPAEMRPPFIRHTIKARLTVRFVSADEWLIHGPDMQATPSRYLYLNKRPDHAYPKPPPAIPPLKERMRQMLQNIDPTHEDVWTFIVGRDQVRMHAHALIVGPMLAVPLLHTHMKEGANKETTLPTACPEDFRAYLEYLYTQDLPYTTLRKHAAGLLEIAGQYLDPVLLYKCEDYLCRTVHVSSPARPANRGVLTRIIRRRARRSPPTSSSSSASPTGTRPSPSRRRASKTCSSTASISSRTRRLRPSIPGF
jgi:hypothetical protein